MSIYEQTFQPYRGPLASPRSRPGVIFRWSWREALASKAVLLLLAAAAISFALFAILIYLHYNLAALNALRLDVDSIVPIDAQFFLVFLGVQAVVAFFLALIVAPPLISRDLANNGLALVLSRPVSRTEYVCGKLLAPLLLLSAVTWMPGLLLFGLQAYLAGSAWLRPNLRLAPALFLGGLLWALMLTFLAFSLAAWLKRRLAASAAFVGLLFIPGLVAGIVDHFLDRPWGKLLNPLGVIQVIWSGLFGIVPAERRFVLVNGARVWQQVPPLPVWSAWLAAAAIFALCVWLLDRRLRAYEEVRG